MEPGPRTTCPLVTLKPNSTMLLMFTSLLLLNKRLNKDSQQDSPSSRQLLNKQNHVKNKNVQ